MNMTIFGQIGRRIAVLDGAMGTRLMERGASGCLEALCLTDPAAVASVHEEYLEAGADIVTTDTMCADALCLERYGLEDRSYEIARAGAEIARAAASKYSSEERPRFVAGSVGPTTRNLSLATDIGPERLAEVYSDVIRGLLDGGADIILVETAMDAANVKVAVEECRKLDKSIPVVVSAVLSRIAGRVASGAPIATFWGDLPAEDIDAVGFNCSNDPKAMEASIAELASLCSKPTIAYPAAGDPPLSPHRFAKDMERLCRSGTVNIVGGCCGITPSHIAQLAKAAGRCRPRKAEIVKRSVTE